MMKMSLQKGSLCAVVFVTLALISLFFPVCLSLRRMTAYIILIHEYFIEKFSYT